MSGVDALSAALCPNGEACRCACHLTRQEKPGHVCPTPAELAAAIPTLAPSHSLPIDAHRRRIREAIDAALADTEAGVSVEVVVREVVASARRLSLLGREEYALAKDVAGRIEGSA